MKHVVAWVLLWFRESLRETLLLIVATVVLVLAGPLGLTFAELASPAASASLVAVTFMSLWGGGRAALLLALGIALSGAVWQGSLPQAATTGVLLSATAYLASARMLALEEERRDVSHLMRTRQNRVRRMEGDVERLAFDRPKVELTNRRRLQEAGKVVTLLGFTKAVVRPGSRETKLFTLFDTLCDVLPRGHVVLVVGNEREFRIVKVFPGDAPLAVGTLLPLAALDCLAALQAGMAPLFFSPRLELVPGFDLSAGVAYSLGKGQLAMVLVHSGSHGESADMDGVMDLLRTAGAAFSLTDEVASRLPRSRVQGGGVRELG